MIITITSGKGGVGKSTTAVNISTGLALHGKKVLIIDGDTGVRKLDILLGLEQHYVFDLVNVIKGECSIDDAILKHPEVNNLYFLPTSQTEDKSAISPEDMVKLVKQVENKFDFIIIDCPAGIEEGFKYSIAPADLVIVIVEPEVASVRDADRVIGILEKQGKERTLIINKIDRKRVKKGSMLDITDIDDILQTSILGIVPFDENISIYSNKGKAIVTNSKTDAGKSYNNIVLRLLGKNIPIPTTYKMGLIKYILGKLFNR